MNIRSVELTYSDNDDVLGGEGRKEKRRELSMSTLHNVPYDNMICPHSTT